MAPGAVMVKLSPWAAELPNPATVDLGHGKAHDLGRVALFRSAAREPREIHAVQEGERTP